MIQETSPLAHTDATASLSPTNTNYDPADYRWVPVARRPRLDGWTEEKQRRFIEALADTGLVSYAAKAVGMSRESANRLRRSPHGASFARAWDAARQHAGTTLEDIAFERAIEGAEHNIYNEHGEVICTKRVYNDRLLTFLLRHLKPERYAGDKAAISNTALDNLASPAPAADTVEACLQAMEPQLPAPPEELLGADELEQALTIADAADGKLPEAFAEQRLPKSSAGQGAPDASEKIAAQEARGHALVEQFTHQIGDEEIALNMRDIIDIMRVLDPASIKEPSQKRYR